MTSHSTGNGIFVSGLAFIVGVTAASWWNRLPTLLRDKTSTTTKRPCKVFVDHDSNSSTDLSTDSDRGSTSSSTSTSGADLSILSCIRNRRSIFPSGFLRNPAAPIDPLIIQSLLDAALWAPFHGRCFKGNNHPAQFVVLGKQSMNEMQHMTLRYYDEHWQTSGWDTLAEYQTWRQRTHDEIDGRWGPVEYMIAIVMRRQSGPKRLPAWEEAAAVAAAVQNMHLQSTKFPHLACYWSSWHAAARDSAQMKAFLKLHDPVEDQCMGFFIVAQAKPHVAAKDYRKRDRSLMSVEWRL